MATERIDIVVSAKGTRTVSRNIERIGQSARKAQGGVALLSRSLGGLFAAGALASGISSAIRTLADFGQEMATVRGITGATAEQFARMSDEAKRLGSTTRFSASDAAQGLKFLARAGFDAEEATQALSGTLNLAQASGIELGRAADIASNVLTGFRKEVGELDNVVDVLALTTNSANTDMTQLGDAMKFVAPVAAGLGVSLEETAAAIGALSDAGLQGTLAGTGLRRVLAELEAPSSKTEGHLKALGVTLESVKPSSVGLTEALKVLKQAGVDTGQAMQLFGQRGGPAFEVMASGIPKIESMTAALMNAEGTAAELSRVMDDTLNGALLSVRSAFEGLILAVGESGATGALKKFFFSLADGIRLLTKNIDTLVTGAKALATVFAVNLAAKAIPAVIVAMRALAVAIAINPIGALATAAVFLIKQLALATAGIVTFGEGLPAVDALIKILSDSWQFLVEIFTGGTDKMGNASTDWGEIINKTAEFIVRSIRSVVDIVDTVVAVFVASKAAIAAAWENLGPILKKIMADAFDGVLTIVENGVNAVILKLSSMKEAVGLAAIESRFTLDKFKKNLPALADDVNPITVLTDTFNANRGQLTRQFEGGVIAGAQEREKAAAVKELTDQYAAYGQGQVAATTAVNQLKKAQEEEAVVLDVAVPKLEKTATATNKVATASKSATKGVDELSTKVEEKASFMEEALTKAFSSAADALTEFITTGQFDFKKFTQSLLADITKLATNSLFSGQGGGLFGGGGGGGGLGGLFSSLFGGGGGIPGFANGGSFEVGGNPGRDRNIMSINGQPAARVARGEMVTVTPKGEGGGGRSVNVTMNIQTPNAESFERSQNQILSRAQSQLSRANARNN